MTAISDNSTKKNNKFISYKSSGVDINAGNKFVKKIGPLVDKTRRPGVISSLGGFGGLFDLKSIGLKNPVLVSSTDGVGTKILLTQNTNMHKFIGVDLVAMCVNDLIVHGAEPLFFLDYLATGKLESSKMAEIVKGIVDGCHEAHCALIGGETAEMPGMYSSEQYELAGFAVGVVEKELILPTKAIYPEDVIVGLRSSGLHSNGFSLVRKIMKVSNVDIDKRAPFNKNYRLSSLLLSPTRIYVKSCLSAIHSYRIKGLAHITGGGLIHNIPRILPDGLGAELDVNSWNLPPLFSWLASVGNITHSELVRTFNCGIGMVLVIAPKYATSLVNHLNNCGESAIIIGKVTKRKRTKNAVEILGLKEAL